MARRITVRLLGFSASLLTLLCVLGKISTYRLTWEAQYESPRAQFDGWRVWSTIADEKALAANSQDANDKGPSRPMTTVESRLLPDEKASTLPHTFSAKQFTLTAKSTSTYIPLSTTTSPEPTPQIVTSATAKSLPSTIPEISHSQSPAVSNSEQKQDAAISTTTTKSLENFPQPHNYTRALVIARTVKEIGSSAWMHDKSIAEDPNITIYPYTVDLPQGTVPTDRTASTNLVVPNNKGHEAMVYLTYMIDHYDSADLADVVLFMHAHRYTWHNNDILDSDALNIVTRLSTPKVLRDGYFNLRCHLDPGCPDHLHPATKTPNPHRPEEMLIGQAWENLFPGESIPEVLSQPCCSQFALSRDMLRSVPLATYERMRNWLIDTPFHDQIAGRVFEYVWQKLYTGQNEWCPVEHVCYCDGYGLCFGKVEKYDKWFDDRKQWRTLARDYMKLDGREKFLNGVGKDPLVDAKKPVGGFPFGEPTVSDEEMKEWGVEQTRNKMAEMSSLLTGLKGMMDDGRRDAFFRGSFPKYRAEDSGRVWKEGDGF